LPHIVNQLINVGQGSNLGDQTAKLDFSCFGKTHITSDIFMGLGLTACRPCDGSTEVKA
jgi:hypothetical protein